MTNLKYGIIGAGMMGREHIRNIALIPGIEIAAICDSNSGMLAEAAAVAGGNVEAFSHHDQLIATQSLDALIVATPNFTHRDIMLDALKSNLPILVEKPLCTTVADCQRVMAAAADRSAPVWVAMEYRYMPPVARLIDEVDAGTVGKLRMLAIREHRFPFLKKVDDWNRFSGKTGGTLVEKCCHFFDLMRLITKSEPKRIYASGAQDVNHLDESYDGKAPDMLDNAYVIVEFDNGVRALLDLCMFAEASQDQEQIAATGDRGKVECTIPSSNVMIGDRQNGDVKQEHIPVDPALLEAGDHHGSTYFQHVAFRDALVKGRPPQVTLNDGLMAVAMGAAAEQSIKTGLPITLDLAVPQSGANRAA